MNCPTEDVLLDYTAGRLEPARAFLFERHAESCTRCEELRAAQSAVWLSLDEWKLAPVSAGFNRELWRRIDADAQTPSFWTRDLARELHEALQFSFWKRLAPLAVALALVATAFVFDHSGKPRANAAAAVVVTVSDADQLDRALDDIQLLHEATTPAKPASGVM